MKSAKDPRHQRRRRVVQELFAESFTKQKRSDELTIKILKKLELIDGEVTISAPQWPVERLNRIDLSILRLAIFEILHTETPPKVVIDEAVELAKEFGGESSPSFVNGVLGNVLKRKEDNENK